MTLVLLQHPKSIQIIIGALIYSHAFHCLSTRDILSPDKLIILPSYQTLSRILLTDHNFTKNISSSPLTTAISCLPGIHPCAHERCTLYERHSHTRGPTKLKVPTAAYVNSSSKQTQTPNTSNGYLLATITSDNHLPPSRNSAISHSKQIPPSEFVTYFWLHLITTSSPSSRCCTQLTLTPTPRSTSIISLYVQSTMPVH